MGKIHTIIVRGVTKDQKNSLKRIARSGNVKQSVNQVMLSIVDARTINEIKDYNQSKKDIKNA